MSATTTTDRPPLTPAEYARALGYTRLLASQQVTAELDLLKARRRAVADSKRRLDEAEAALEARKRNLLHQQQLLQQETGAHTHTPTPAGLAAGIEPTTPIHPSAAVLQAPTPPDTHTPEPAASTVRHRILPRYFPAPSPAPRLPLPRLNPDDPESVRKWAMRRWPDPPKRAQVRLRIAAAEADMWHATKREK